MMKRILVANYLAGAWSALMGVLFVPLYIKFLGIEAYGLIGIFASMQVWFALLDMGMAPALSREMARFRAGARTASSTLDLFFSLQVIYLLIGLSFALLVCSCAQWLSSWWLLTVSLSTETVRHALVLIGIVVAIRWLGTLYRGALLGLELQVPLSKFNIVFSTLRGAGVTLVLIYVDPTIGAFFFYQACVAGMEALALAAYVHRVLPSRPRRPRFSLESIAEIRRFAIGMALITMLSILLTQVDKIVLSKLLPLTEFGYYSLATTVASVLYLLITPVANAAYPRLTGLVTSDRSLDLINTYHTLSQILSAMLIPAAVVMAIFSRHLLLLWTRNEVTTAAVAPLLSILLLGNMLNGLMHMPYNLQLAHGWTRFTVWVNLVSIAILIPAMCIGVMRYGAIAAALAWVALNFGYVLIAVPLMHRKILPREKWPWYIFDVARPLGVTLVVSVVVRFLSSPADINNPWASIETLLLAGIGAGTAAMLTVPVVRNRLLSWIGVK